MIKNFKNFLLMAMLILACGPLSIGREQKSPLASPHPAPGQSKEEARESPTPNTKTEADAEVTATDIDPAPEIDKWNLWVNGPHLRGANIWQAIVVPELDGLEFKGDGRVGPPYVQEDFDQLAALGANYVSISGPGLFTETPPYTVDPDVQENLDDLLTMIANADMFATIGFRTGPGRSEFSLCCGESAYFEEYFNDTVWEDQAAQDAWVEMWRYTAQRYRDNPVVAGYKLMVEPNSAGVFFDIDDPDEFYTQYAGTLYDWNQFYPRLVNGIRQVDPNTPLLVGGNGWSAVPWLSYLHTVDDPHIVYIVHQYEPQNDYTHQEGTRNSYPGQFDTNGDGKDDRFDRAWLENFLQPVANFSAKNNVSVAVDEFGVNRWVPGAAQFMDDQMDLFEQMGMNQAVWEWSAGWRPFVDDVNDMTYRFGPDRDNRTEVPNELIDIIKKYWTRNTLRPSNFAAKAGSLVSPSASSAATGPPDLADVADWFYMIDVNLEPEMVQQIAASEYDMVVLDFIPSEVENTAYPMAQVVDQLHNAPHPKLVVAYIDIGQAESYRTYWQPGWGIGNPEWIVGTDPDGWEGNFPVAYWHDDWYNIWLGQDGYLQAIVDAGFDGVYLDWVEAYSDENVIVAAQYDEVDPRQEMIWWVGDIAEFTQTQNQNFVIIAQNAAELAEDDDYLDIIDAIAQEQVWFDGGADNNPPGDCPLPRTEADVDTEAYLNSLSSACRQQYNNFPDGTLHISSEEYLYYLTLARDKGKIIFTVDYAQLPENVAWVYKTSRASGFIPFVSNRALNQYVDVFR